MMEALTNFKFPFARDSKPLQTLSQERVNASRPASTTTTTPTKTTEESDPFSAHASPQSSPTRKAKANLFSEFHPSNGTPPRPMSSFGGLPQSPSLPEINVLRAHVRTNSDVQGLVKRFEHLDVRDRDAESQERRKRHEAELRRAQIAREEAESDVKRLREDVRRLEKEAEAGRDRERKVAKRLEVVMEDYGTTKDSQSSQNAIYEKELRKARKEAFKSSSAILKLQEELKSTRNSLRITQSGFDLEKQKVQRKEQERFEMEYQFIPLQEEVEKLTQKLKIVESEKEALKANLKEEEITRVAAEGMIALPASQDLDMDLFSSPQKKAASPLSDDKENIGVMSKKALETRRLAEEFEREKIRREQAEELAEFLRMECLFRCCPCKRVTNLEHELALCLDAELAAGLTKIKQGMEEILSPPQSPVEVDQMEIEQAVKTTSIVEDVAEIKIAPEVAETTTIHTVSAADLDRSMTITADSPDDQLRQEAEMAFRAGKAISTLENHEPTQTEIALAVPLQPSSPATPSHQTMPFRHQTSIRTITTTTSVPMHFTPVSKPQPIITDPEDVENRPPRPDSVAAEEGTAPPTPSFDRAAALAAIEYRRGRAKSIADGLATPQKQMMEGVGRRDISAPALGVRGGQGAGSVKGRSGSAGRGMGRR